MSNLTAMSTTCPSQNSRYVQDGLVALVDDLRIKAITPLVSPSLLLSKLPQTPALVQHIKTGRTEIHNILHGHDDRLIVVVGPCSIHDVEACQEYAEGLQQLSKEHEKDLKIIMRVYFEKPRTTVGWKGLINDPDLDGSNNINKGLKLARKFLVAVNKIGLHAGVEFLDTITPQYFSDLVTWGAIGARTTESQVHRELSSGLSCPIGFKNGTSGNIQVAVDACLASSMPHSFLGITKDGVCAIVHTGGNPDYHIILRGGTQPNYESSFVNQTAQTMKKSSLDPRLIIDCSHGNSSKNFRNQPTVAQAVAQQIAEGDYTIKGVMIESHLIEGNQQLVPGVTDLTQLKRGVSVTDACINLDTTAQVLRELSAAIQQRRKILADTL